MVLCFVNPSRLKWMLVTLIYELFNNVRQGRNFGIFSYRQKSWKSIWIFFFFLIFSWNILWKPNAIKIIFFSNLLSYSFKSLTRMKEGRKSNSNHTFTLMILCLIKMCERRFSYCLLSLALENCHKNSKFQIVWKAFFFLFVVDLTLICSLHLKSRFQM